jgi:hypothetical protein
LNEPEVCAALGEIVAARVPERMRMDVQMFEVGAFGRAVEHELYGAGAKRGTAFRGEHIVACGVEILAARRALRTVIESDLPRRDST